MQTVLSVGTQDKAVRLFGPHERFLKLLRDAFGVTVVARGGEVSIDGEPENVKSAERVLHRLLDLSRHGESLTEVEVKRLINMEKQRVQHGDKSFRETRIEGFRRGDSTVPRTSGQADYIRAMQKHDIVFCIGPAGTGKTYLAVAMALKYMKQGQVDKLVLCRPAVEAGERLGFLPGDMQAKVNPYLRPLYDALHDLMDSEQVNRYIEKDIIEILPLAFVRGRTLEDAFIILDEAQNCTVDQMKTFLTRLGVSSRLVVTGDITQIDLPDSQTSGLVDVQYRLSGVKGVTFVRLTSRDIVRHQLVKDIVHAYRTEPSESTESEPEERTSDG